MSSVRVLMKVFFGYLKDLGFHSMMLRGVVLSSLDVVVSFARSNVHLDLFVVLLGFCGSLYLLFVVV